MKKKKEKIKINKRKIKEKKRKVKKKIRKEIVISAVLICLVTLVFFLADYFITGQIVTSVPYVCKDSDGKDFYKEGEVDLYNVMNKPFIEKVFHDYCSNDKIVVEYYCVWEKTNYVAKAEEKYCEFGCYASACISPRSPESENIFIKIYNALF